MAIIILIDISIMNIVVVISRNDSIIQMGVPLLVQPLEAIIMVRRVEVFPSTIVSCIFVIIVPIDVLVIIRAKIVVVGTNVVSLEIIILSL